MTGPRQFILAFWALFAAYWAISAIGVKRNIGGRDRWRGAGLRLGLVLLVLLAARSPSVRDALWAAQLSMAQLHLGVAGVALCALGMGLAIWARMYLGRNWGMPMSRKEDPELVMAGPYAFARHPIYGGVLLAMLGSAIGGSVFWLLPLVLFGAYFIYSARGEERLMLAQFPQQYAAYMQRTKMLLPFVL